MTKKAAQATPNQLLRMARLERGWTQKEVADRIGAPLDLNVTRWERGTAWPSAYYVQKLCELFSKSASELGLLPPQLEATVSSQPGPTRSEHELPTGTITLLFADMEGSTRLLQHLGDRYASVLSECRQVLRAAFGQWNGNVVDTQGDAFFVVFARATDAVSAAVAAQRTLASHAFLEGVAVRVRVSLHTGEPQRTADGYVGLDVHRAARIMSAGHGGQVLLSQTTRDLVEHDLPDGVSLRDLGEYHLKDLQRPNQLYQLVIAGLPGEFPSLQTLDSHLNNLPIQPTALIGREQELAAVQHLLRHEAVRLLTLTGPGGTGKTRMALQAAADLSDDFGDGVFFVALAPIRDTALVVPTMVQILGLKDVGDRQPLARLQTYLCNKHLLLVLDNFEHLAPAASLLAELLETCPRLKLLVTSRELLHLRAEHQFPVLPLALPNLRDLPNPETLSHYAAVELFVERAQAVVPDFQLTPENARMISEICVRLDGLPLAIELAAARINLLPPQALLNRLGRRLQVLTSKLRDVPERQQTLRKTLTWSYDLLTQEEQCLFRRLSIFVGSWSLEAAEAVCKVENDKAIDILDGMTSLIEKSLMQKHMVMGGEPRLMMLETVREYGLERLADSGEAGTVQRAHAAFFLALAEEAELELHGARQAGWMERLEREHDNLRATLRWSLEIGEQESALRVGGALWWFWNIQGHASEGRRFLERALVGSDKVVVPVRAKALRTAGGLAYVQGDYDQAENLCRDSLTLFRELSDTRYTAEILWMLGQIAWARGNYARARELVEEAREILTAAGDRQLIILVLIMLARVEIAQGEYTGARSLLEESLKISREVDDKFHIANALGQLAKVYFFSQGDAATARSLYEEALGLYRVFGPTWTSAYTQSDLSQVVLYQGDKNLASSLVEESLVLLREVGDRRDLARALIFSADIPAFQGDYATAHALYAESLKLLIQVEDKQYIAFGLERLGQVVAKQGEPAWAARLWGAAEMLRETMGSPMPPVYRTAYEQAVAAARTQLGEKVFVAAWAQGRTMTPEQVQAAGDEVFLQAREP